MTFHCDPPSSVPGTAGPMSASAGRATVEDCTACEDRSRCHEMFTCETCGLTLNCCVALPAWPTSRLSECVQCWEARELPPGWDDELPKVLSRIRSAEKKRQEKAAVVAGA